MTALAERDYCPGCGGPADDHYFDRTLCPCFGGTMHNRCVSCGYPLDGCGYVVAQTSDRAQAVATEIQESSTSEPAGASSGEQQDPA